MQQIKIIEFKKTMQLAQKKFKKSIVVRKSQF